MIRLDKNGVRWEMQPDIALVLDEILTLSGSTIKEAPAKLVTVHSVRGKTYYVKRYRHSAVALRPLKFFFKPSQARQEWELAQKLETLGLPIVRHVAIGERWSWRGLLESMLITEGFDGKPLNEVAEVNPEAALRFVNRMHELGVLQRDLHPGNILVAPRTGEMRLVDLYCTEIKPYLTEAERALNLALLRIHLPVKVSPEVERLSAQERRRRLYYRSKRCLKHNREFAPKNLGGLPWQIRLPFQNAEVERLLAAPDEFLAARAHILKPGRSSTVGKAGGLVLKRYNFRKFGNLFKDLFRLSKARRAFRKAYHLELVGIPTARCIATADRRVARVLLHSYFLMEEIPGAIHLGQWRGDNAHAIQAVAALLAKLHNLGFSHRDLKETNLIFDRDQRLYLIDFEGLEYLETVPPDRARADFARLERALAALPQFSEAERIALRERYEKLRGQLATPSC
jgi:tRNA A-37 threonylcarbamoyl transferase component Bud32